jgi:HD-GYP domain-containing protein (c-di-GMP phosphodiesterase class II)
VNLAQTPEAQQIQAADEPMDSSKVEIVQNENEFIPILTSQFLAGAASHFNLYIKLADKRFIKILRRGDSLGHDRLEFYKKKSVSQFYIRQTDFGDFLSFCSQKLSEVLENPKVSTKEKTCLTLQHGKQVMAFLQSRKIAPQAIRHAQEFVENVLALTEHLKLEEIAEIKKHLTNADFRDHASANTLISAILGQKLGLRGEKMSILLGTASFLHDIGLPESSPMFLNNDEKAMTQAERKAYLEHPIVGAEILKKLGRLEPIAIQAVAQHHERRNGKGFPEKLGAGQINLISEIVGMSDELMQQIALCSKNGNRDPFREMEEKSFDGFSSPVIDAFRKCFGSN